MKRYSIEDSRELLQQRLKTQSQYQFATQHRLSPSYVNDVVHGRRKPGPAILRALDLKKVEYYVKAVTWSLIIIIAISMPAHAADRISLDAYELAGLVGKVKQDQKEKELMKKAVESKEALLKLREQEASLADEIIGKQEQALDEQQRLILKKDGDLYAKGKEATELSQALTRSNLVIVVETLAVAGAAIVCRYNMPCQAAVIRWVGR